MQLVTADVCVVTDPLMWAYTESIFFRAHDLTKEFHGPYLYASDTKRFVIREFRNLQPRELWPDICLPPLRSIMIYKQYKEPITLNDWLAQAPPPRWSAH